MSLQQTIESTRYFLPGERAWGDVVERCLKVWQAVNAPRSLQDEFRYLMQNKIFIPGGRILRNAGLPYHQLSNCFLFNVEDSREGWGQLANKATVALMTGGGVGVDYGAIRPSGSILNSTYGVASGPIPLIKTVNEIGRGVQCGGFRRSALYASLPWWHKDIFDFIHMKDWPQWLRDQKSRDMDVAAPGDMTNISVRLDKAFFEAYEDPWHPHYDLAGEVYAAAIESMLRTGEPGFQVDFDNQILRNACTEIISADDSDSCVLGAINLPKCAGLATFRLACEVGTAFLLAVTQYNQSPTEKCREVQHRNRRLGLELMGVGEWFIQQGLLYGDTAIDTYLQVYKDVSTQAARTWALRWNMPTPIAVRAIGPTGTISIVGETTSGIEPLFAQAYERRYLTKNGFETQMVIDPVALRYRDRGEALDDCAYNIPWDRRVAFQHRVQQYVDNAISSTVNLPDTNQDARVFGDIVMKYLPGLRGLTAFPNGSRGLQPITPMTLDDALLAHAIVESTDNACPSGVCAL